MTTPLWRQHLATAPTRLQEIIALIEAFPYGHGHTSPVTHVQFGHKGCRLTLHFGFRLHWLDIQLLANRGYTIDIEASQTGHGCLPVIQLILQGI